MHMLTSILASDLPRVLGMNERVLLLANISCNAMHTTMYGWKGWGGTNEARCEMETLTLIKEEEHKNARPAPRLLRPCPSPPAPLAQGGLVCQDDSLSCCCLLLCVVFFFAWLLAFGCTVLVACYHIHTHTRAHTK